MSSLAALFARWRGRHPFNLVQYQQGDRVRRPIGRQFKLLGPVPSDIHGDIAVTVDQFLGGCANVLHGIERMPPMEPRFQEIRKGMGRFSLPL